MTTAPTAISVLLIDDDEELALIVQRYLSQFNCHVTLAEAPSHGYQLLTQHSYDVILLDVMLPEQDGFEVCRRLLGAPQLYGQAPIIMLTARGDVIDRIIGLELGAQDYLPKPFEPRELLARIRNVARRQPAPPPLSPALAGLTLDHHTQQAWVDAQNIELTSMEWELLNLFSNEPGRLFTRDDIMDALRGIDADVFSRAIDALVSRLRHKLGDTAKTPRFIKTVWGRGYLFLGQETLQLRKPRS